MLFSLDIGIDLGTANTLVFVKGKGIVIREPSVVAVDQKYNPPRVVAVGTEAKEMIGRTPGSITAVRPLKDGVIADFDITADMLKAFIKKVTKNSPLARVRVMICIPSGVTGVERNAVNDAARSAGAKYVSLIEEPMAAAIGAGLPVSEPTRLGMISYAVFCLKKKKHVLVHACRAARKQILPVRQRRRQTSGGRTEYPVARTNPHRTKHLRRWRQRKASRPQSGQHHWPGIPEVSRKCRETDRLP